MTTNFIFRSIFTRSTNSSRFLFYSSTCYFASRPRPDPTTYLFRPQKSEVIQDISEQLENEKIKYRRHPGVMQLPLQSVDREIQETIGRILQQTGESIASYRIQGKEMERHMKNRRLPLERYDLEKIRRDIEQRLRKSEEKKFRTFETIAQQERYEENFQKKLEKRTQSSIYKWKSMEYNTITKCLTYCVMRFAPEYAIMRRLFSEITKRESNFKPRHVFDFGSGVGTTLFAAEKTWPDRTIDEYICVDTSPVMIDLLNLFLRGGDDKNQEQYHRNVTFRQFLPATNERRFDLVVSAFSLFELPSYEERMRTVANLWMKTNRFLILVERGTNAGFRAIVEARDYLLAGGHEIHRHTLSTILKEKQIDPTEIENILQTKNKSESEKFQLLHEKYPDMEFPTLLSHGHVFAPCPHDMGCPRLLDVTPCNFEVKYFPLRLSGGAERAETELYSYVILKKGYAPMTIDRWPRIVREPRRSKNCIWCQTCSPHGVLEDRPFHKKKNNTDQGRQYRLAKRSSWGDLMPVATSYEEQSSKIDGNLDEEMEETTEDEEDENKKLVTGREVDGK